MTDVGQGGGRGSPDWPVLWVNSTPPVLAQARLVLSSPEAGRGVSGLCGARAHCEVARDVEQRKAGCAPPSHTPLWRPSRGALPVPGPPSTSVSSPQGRDRQMCVAGGGEVPEHCSPTYSPPRRPLDGSSPEMDVTSLPLAISTDGCGIASYYRSSFL